MKDYGRKNSEHISIGNWMLTLFFTLIPGIGLIALVFCLCSKKRSKRNFALAIIVWILIFAVLCTAAYLIIRFGFPDLYNTISTAVSDFIQVIKDLLSGSPTESFLLPR